MSELALKQATASVAISIIIPINMDAKDIVSRFRQELTDTTTKFLLAQRNLILVSNEISMTEKAGTLNGIS